MIVGPLVGYRPDHAPLLRGAWVPGELLCFSRNEARPAGRISQVPEPAAAVRARMLVIPGVAFARLTEIEPVHRRARVEVGIQGAFDPATAAAVLARILETAFGQLNLERILGWVRGSHPATHDVLREAGFERELTLPRGVRAGGELVARELWATAREAWR